MRNLGRAGILTLSLVIGFILSITLLYLSGSPAYGYVYHEVVTEEEIPDPIDPVDDWQGEICPEGFEPEWCEVGPWPIDVPVDELGIPEAYGEIG